MIRSRALGRTGLQISELGFGCGPTAKLMVGGHDRQRVAIIGRALDAGITYFDTAARYGDGRSELNLGEALRALRARPVVATKVTIEAVDLDDIATAVERSAEGSLKRLRLDVLDVLHLHNRVGRSRADRPDIGSGILLSVDDILGFKGAAEGFARLQRRGLIRVAGACAYGGDMDAASEVIASGAFDSLLVNYSLLNPSAWSAGEFATGPDYHGLGAQAAGKGCGIVALRVLEAGRLTGRDASGDLERYGFLLDSCTDLAEASIRFVLSNPSVSTALIGISDLAQLEAALRAAERGALPGDSLERLRFDASQ